MSTRFFDVKKGAFYSFSGVYCREVGLYFIFMGLYRHEDGRRTL